MLKLYLLFFTSVVVKVWAVTPAACRAEFRWDDCGRPPKPVMYYWKAGSRCEVGIWKGCLPNPNMFPDEYACINTCVFQEKLTARTEDPDPDPVIIVDNSTKSDNTDSSTDHSGGNTGNDGGSSRSDTGSSDAETTTSGDGSTGGGDGGSTGGSDGSTGSDGGNSTGGSNGTEETTETNTGSTDAESSSDTTT